MTLQAFSDIFALLAVQLRFSDADEMTVRGYYEALKDLEPELIAMAAKRMAISAAWFPKTSEWREAVLLVEGERIAAQKALLRKLPERLCSACEDTGWAPFTDAKGVERVGWCDCQKIRRLEVLGRRPWPILELEPVVDGTQEARALSLARSLVERRGF